MIDDLRRHKIPALRHAKLRVEDPRIVIFSRAGFGDGLREHANGMSDVSLVTAHQVVRDLTGAHDR